MLWALRKAMPLFLAPRDANDERRGSREAPVLDRLVDPGMPVATREAGSTAAPPFALQAAGRPDATVDLEPLISGRGNPSRLCPGSSIGRAGVGANPPMHDCSLAHLDPQRLTKSRT